MKKDSQQPGVDKIGLANLLNLDDIAAQDEVRRKKGAKKRDKPHR